MTATHRTSPRNSRGFTLIEMLMAMLVMTVGLLGLLQSVQTAYRQGLRDRVRNEAVLLAEERMHEWRRMSFRAISATSPKAELAQRMIAGAPREFNIVRDVTEMGGGASESAKKLRVGVSWSIKGETSHHEIYTMRIRRPDES